MVKSNGAIDHRTAQPSDLGPHKEMWRIQQCCRTADAVDRRYQPRNHAMAYASYQDGVNGLSRCPPSLVRWSSTTTRQADSFGDVVESFGRDFSPKSRTTAVRTISGFVSDETDYVPETSSIIELRVGTLQPCSAKGVIEVALLFPAAVQLAVAADDPVCHGPGRGGSGEPLQSRQPPWPSGLRSTGRHGILKSVGPDNRCVWPGPRQTASQLNARVERTCGYC